MRSAKINQTEGGQCSRVPNSNRTAITVCMVDADELFRGMLERWLSPTQGICLIGSYRDAESALPNILQNKPDAVILDYGLPGMNGGELIRYLKEKLAEIRILVLTDIPDKRVLFDSLRAGADGFIEKSDEGFSGSTLIRQIRDLHAGMTPLSQRPRRFILEAIRDANSLSLDPLTDREKQVVELLERGLSDKEIAQSLHVEECTIKTHAHHIYEKLCVRGRTEILAKKWSLARERREGNKNK